MILMRLVNMSFRENAKFNLEEVLLDKIGDLEVNQDIDSNNLIIKTTLFELSTEFLGSF